MAVLATVSRRLIQFYLERGTAHPSPRNRDMDNASNLTLLDLPNMMDRASVTVKGRPEMAGCFYDCALYLLVRLPTAQASSSWIDTGHRRLPAIDVAQAYERGYLERPDNFYER